ncbi:ATP-binding cassette domain-containing protein [Marinicella meishanensis]|uniref:ATP-binding cassette domain-containing protein n=1 Tax=Marinicella meishanensis TaxID=2873263 RepID=UPI001CC04F0C|nr:ABC transporter ATP-binding protein [Marinicella sp. NBU2979]
MDKATEFSKQLKLKQINLTRSGQKILDDVTVELPTPGITVLLGANGAGKSSLLRVLAGISQPDSGSGSMSDSGGAFLMPEPAVFYPHLTVTEQLQFVADQSAMTPTTSIDEVLSAWQLQAEANKLTAHLSLGFRQRLSMAQLTLSQAGLLLLDEPMNGMDPEVMMLFKQQVANWRQAQTVVMATHIMHEAEAMADWVVVMHRGRVLHAAAYHQEQPFNELYQGVMQQFHAVSVDHQSPTQVGGGW